MSKVASAADGRRLLPRLPVSLPLDPSRVVNVPGCGGGSSTGSTDVGTRQSNISLTAAQCGTNYVVLTPPLCT